MEDTADSTVVLQQWRSLRQEQDKEFEQSLMADREKEMRHQYLEAQEKSRLQVIEDRRKRIANHEEPIDGVPIKFKFPNGMEKIRKFILSETIQILFDFVGQDDLSSEVFYVQDATSSTPLENNLSGTLNDYNIQGHSTLYVVWVSPMDENEASIQVNSGEFNFTSFLFQPVACIITT
ncbi:FAS-associated factor 2-like [Megalobrama amblycephala]|uniref:FAS-associated factor 2-like n=1 Tax=Megalobrama amblycephala TaxID=75352 RepID=UPI002013C55C|nr:FAS-associated factor 2-like [Megalobrama amblycephala]